MAAPVLDESPPNRNLPKRAIDDDYLAPDVFEFLKTAKIEIE
jgi:hypothetical protein